MTTKKTTKAKTTTAYLLFGLATAGCAASPTTPQFPLCDDDGAPACGNIGQVGRAAPTPAERDARPRAVVGAATTIASSATRGARIVPVVVRVLLGASSEGARGPDAMRPLADRRGELACGNVMGKGGRRRVCRETTVTGTTITETYLDHEDLPIGQLKVTSYPRD